ncbi:dynein light chain 2 cytoplasmic [Anaeramoeba ignava]|uniref:Dynein light chain 1, cytoplasmic n=1 Tax=Anaeramoeba ignava TaxID=1746090 RepID=A0A9Q0R471_ANAIG|nr:dynein light chain 2 cytoplasmic [Anaeramoeba ignava]
MEFEKKDELQYVVSLLDPLNGERIRTPVRGTKCNHFDCFDHQTFLAHIQNNGGVAKCPYCFKFLRPQDLVISKSMTSLLSSKPENVEQVVISRNSDMLWKVANSPKPQKLNDDYIYSPQKTSLQKIERNESKETETTTNKTSMVPVMFVMINSVDMPPDMQNDAVRTAINALYTKMNSEQEVAQYIKQSFDTKYGKSWNCIVGQHFGANVTSMENHMIYFMVGTMSILLFKTKVHTQKW